MLIAKTPFRISLFGGGSDYPQHFDKHGGAVIAGSINKYCFITYRNVNQDFGTKYRVRYSFSEASTTIDGIAHPAVKALLKYFKINYPVEINHSADLPARSGIGSSSSFVTGLTSILLREKNIELTNHELSQLVVDIEQNYILENVGYQDSVTAVYGGLNLIEFSNNNKKFVVNEITASTDYLRELSSNMMLVRIASPRIASEIAKEQIATINQHSIELTYLASLARDCAEQLNCEKLEINEIGNLLNESWEIKKKQSSLITNSEIDSFYEFAKRNGAIGGKLCGAGAGGFFLIAIPKNLKTSFRSAATGLDCVDFEWDFNGNSVIQIY